jgi:hypothetical protein
MRWVAGKAAAGALHSSVAPRRDSCCGASLQDQLVNFVSRRRNWVASSAESTLNNSRSVRY